MAIGPERRTMTRAQAADADIDVGLRNYMLGVYNYMCLGIALAGVVAGVVVSNPTLVATVQSLPVMLILFAALMGLGMFAGRVMFGGSMALAQGGFWAYAALWGLLLAPQVYRYEGASVAQAFFITAGMFGAMSLFGYTTKKDLAPMGRFLAMATFGILIAVLVNAFIFQDFGFHLLLSVVVVLVFAGLTAYETQEIKNAYYEMDDQDTQTRKSIFGAFLLFGSFATMFSWILSLVGMGDD